MGRDRQGCSFSDKVAPSLIQDSRTGQQTPASNGAKDCSPQGRASSRPSPELDPARCNLFVLKNYSRGLQLHWAQPLRCDHLAVSYDTASE